MHMYIFFCTFAALLSNYMNEIVEYIIQFLVYGDEHAAKQVGYTADESQWGKYRVVIVPSGHLGKEIVVPELDRCAVDKVTGDKEMRHATWIIRTDIVYNTFFFISRAEELINHQRDEHGRFLAKHSILGQNNRLMIPTVDEYARMLMKLLDMPMPTPLFSHIYLTHDVDTIEQYRHWRGALGGILRGKVREVLASLKDIHNDPAFTFSWLISQDKKVEGAKCIYFVKDTLGKGYDYPQYELFGKDFETVKDMIEQSGAEIGLHSSYYGHESTPSEVYGRLLIQQNEQPEKPICHRSHYLNCSIDQMQRWAKIGITDDFTMMFPDQVGFRLQTTRPVRWINPQTMKLTNLVLHPMTIMDCTLSNPQYMNLSEDEAYFECQRLFEKIQQNAGEVVLLWHNTSVTPDSYHRSLYPKLLNILTEKK